jgi:hypothetical protein
VLQEGISSLRVGLRIELRNIQGSGRRVTLPLKSQCEK